MYRSERKRRMNAVVSVETGGSALRESRSRQHEPCTDERTVSVADAFGSASPSLETTPVKFVTRLASSEATKRSYAVERSNHPGLLGPLSRAFRSYETCPVTCHSPIRARLRLVVVVER